MAAVFEQVSPHLDERQRRLLAGAQARAWGRGGIRVVAQAAGMRERTVARGAHELAAGAAPRGGSEPRARAANGHASGIRVWCRRCWG